MDNLIPIAQGKTVNNTDDVKSYFLSHGLSVNAWCKQHSFSRNVVKNLLSGRGRGNRGETHLAAIALGLKLSPTTLPESGNT